MICEKRQRSNQRDSVKGSVKSSKKSKKLILIQHRPYDSDDAEELKSQPQLASGHDESEASAAPNCLKPGRGALIRRSDQPMVYPQID